MAPQSAQSTAASVNNQKTKVSSRRADVPRKSKRQGSSSVGSKAATQCIGNYMIGKTIGQGTFGKVKSGMHILTGEKVAIKLLEKSKLQEAADIERVSREIKILKRNRHRNVIQLFEVMDTPTTIYLIMEHADGGEMFNYIVKNQRIPEREAALLFRQIIEGVDYLHGMEITHRDLKPENVLLQSSRNGWIVKIVDFGLSNTHTGGRLLKTACGSPCYAAPEMIAGKEYAGPSADIWSLGVIFFAMTCGYLPFENENTNILYKTIMAGRYKCPNHLSAGAKDMLKCILNTNPDTRFSIDQIRNHIWMNGSILRATTPMKRPEDEGINEVVLSRLQQLGVNTQRVSDDVAKKLHNQLTASYYLLLNKHDRCADAFAKEVQHTANAASTIPAQESQSNNTDSLLVLPKASGASEQCTIPRLELSMTKLKVGDKSPNACLKPQAPPIHKTAVRTNGIPISARNVRSKDTRDHRIVQTSRTSNSTSTNSKQPMAPTVNRRPSIRSTAKASPYATSLTSRSIRKPVSGCWQNPRPRNVNVQTISTVRRSSKGPSGSIKSQSKIPADQAKITTGILPNAK